VEIYSRARQGISLTINALSTLIFLVTLVLAVGYYVMNARVTAPGRPARVEAGE